MSAASLGGFRNVGYWSYLPLPMGYGRYLPLPMTRATRSTSPVVRSGSTSGELGGDIGGVSPLACGVGVGSAGVGTGCEVGVSASFRTVGGMFRVSVVASG